MIDKKNIAKFFKRKSRPLRTSHTRFSDVRYVWKIIISVFAVLNIGIMAFSGYLFFQINDGDIFNVEEEATIFVETIDRTLLRETLASFEERENELKKLKEKRPNVIDPSI